MSSKLARWAVTIQSYPFILEHVPTEINSGPDALSRLSCYENEPNAGEELEEFLDEKILKVGFQGNRKGAQISTITFENGNREGLDEGEIEGERQELLTSELADPETELSPPQTKMEWVKSKDIIEMQERERGFTLVTEGRCGFRGHD